MELFKLEERVFSLGNWASLEELESNITMTELHRLLLAVERKDHEDKMFAASLKGIKLDPWRDPDEDGRMGDRNHETPQERAKRIKREGELQAAKELGLIGDGYQDEDAPLYGFAIESEDD